MDVSAFRILPATTRPTVVGMSEQPPSTLPSAGWYPHPEGAGTRRYWDGQRWTDGVVKSAPSAWVAVGWVCAFVFPLAGFAIGFFLPRRYSQQGVYIMVVSVVVGAIILGNLPD